ncbi:MAG: glucose-6-phosphate isomerase family protein [Candidatus Roizmanbacteria bacterium]|nr:glucose-6-phosphate isomerase family protein [Candidatus Roizmanbacteria bacterium]
MNIDFKNVNKHYAERIHEKMKEVLMDPNGVGPAVHYYMIRGGKEQKNITVWEPGTISGEYIKTYGHYHVGKLNETYWIIFGTGIALLQKLVVDEKGNMIADVVEEFKAIQVKQDDKVYMPAGYGHLLVNISDTYFVTADDSPVDFEEKDSVSLPGHADYSLVKKMKGFAYYVVEHEGKPALIKNKLYKEIKKQDLDGLKVIG